jgi:hypothetical protein
MDFKELAIKLKTLKRDISFNTPKKACIFNFMRIHARFVNIFNNDLKF